MKIIDYTLPEFVFLDGNSHLGNTLEGRDVMVHVRSYTILEIVSLDTVVISDFKSKTYEFEYKDPTGIKERHLFALHFTLAGDDELTDIFKKCEKWYCAYLKWEDRNIITDETAKHN